MTKLQYTEKPVPTGFISLDYDWVNEKPVYNPKPRPKIGLETSEDVKRFEKRLDEAKKIAHAKVYERIDPIKLFKVLGEYNGISN